MLPENMPILTETFNQDDLKDINWPEIKNRNRRTATTHSVNPTASWCIAQPETWSDFQNVLNAFIDNPDYPNEKINIGFGKHYRCLNDVVISSSDPDKTHEKETRLRKELEQKKQSHQDMPSVKSPPVLSSFKDASGNRNWKAFVGVLERDTNNFYWINNAKQATQISGNTGGPQENLGL